MKFYPREKIGWEKLEALIEYLPQKEKIQIKKAYIFAQRAHQGQKRFSGAPYFSHPSWVAEEIARMHYSSEMIIASLLHDTLEDTSATYQEIYNLFGKDVAEMVDGVTKLSAVRLKKTWFGLGPIQTEKMPELMRQTETLKKMFLAMGKDIRVVIIKIIDRMHNMFTILHLPKEKQIRFAQETLDIFAPLAYRLGMGEIKGQLEDLAFPILHPKEAKEIEEKIKIQRRKKRRIIGRTINVLHRLLRSHSIKPVSVHGRIKHTYSLYKKLKRYDGDISKIYDLVAIRIIVNDIDECYHTLGIVHKRWRPLPGRIKDYIALPKPNGYSSLHTTVFGPSGEILEIQIRTPHIHDHAEYGMAAHWRYKEESWGKKLKSIFPQTEQGAKWLKDLIAIQKSMNDPEEMAQALKLDFFSDRIFVFTPDGDVIDLPQDASPIDFAFSIHTELGNHYGGAKVNNKIVASDFKLKNGDICEIIKNKTGSPKRDWLEFVKTSDAKGKIKRGLKGK